MTADPVRQTGGHPPTGGGDDDDPLLSALAELVRTAADVERAVHLLTARADGMRTARRAGGRWRDIVDGEERPLIAEMLTDTISRFEAAGTRFRREKARALHDEGLTMEQIADLFGLSRQRISALLHGTPRTGRR